MPLPDRWKGPPRMKKPKTKNGPVSCPVSVAAVAPVAAVAAVAPVASIVGVEDRKVDAADVRGGLGQQEEGGISDVEVTEVSQWEAGVRREGTGGMVGRVGGVLNDKMRPLRLFVFGMAKARKTVSSQIRCVLVVGGCM